MQELKAVQQQLAESQQRESLLGTQHSMALQVRVFGMTIAIGINPHCPDLCTELQQ